MIGIIEEDPSVKYGGIIFKNHHAVHPYQVAGILVIIYQILRRSDKFGKRIRYGQIKIGRGNQPGCIITGRRIGAPYMLYLKKRFRRIPRLVIIE